MEFFTPEVIQSFGSAAAATFLSVFFIIIFTRFQEKSLDRILKHSKDQLDGTLKEMEADRTVFKDAIEKIDRRLEIQEILISHLKDQINK